MSSLLSYHIFSFFISNIFENFKFGRNFSKFTAGMGCRLVAVSVKIGGNRRLPIGKENTAQGSWLVGNRRRRRCSSLSIAVSFFLVAHLPAGPQTDSHGRTTTPMALASVVVALDPSKLSSDSAPVPVFVAVPGSRFRSKKM